MTVLRGALLTLLTLLALLAWAGGARAQVGDEVPFITTPDNVTLAMLELAGVKRRDHVLDLGSGDGRIVITAAKRFGARATGVEIVPDLVTRSRENARRAGVESRTRFVEQDLFKTDLSTATVITMYLLPEVNLQLRPRLLALKPGTRIVSHDWDLGDWRPDRTITIDAPTKTIGRDKRSHLHRWVVPATAHGLWCAPGNATLRIEQKHQFVEATLQLRQTQSSLSGRLDGRTLRLQGSNGAVWVALIDGERLRLAPQRRGLAAPSAWRLTNDASCSDTRRN